MAYKTQLTAYLAHTKGEFVPGFNTKFPPHPAIVHFPIAFNILTWSLNILYALGTNLTKPAFLIAPFSDDGVLLDITRLSHFMLSLSLLSSVPAIMSGNAQLFGMVQRNGGLWEKNESGNAKDKMVPRIRLAISHAVINISIFIVNMYTWRTRKAAGRRSNDAYAPGHLDVFMSIIMLPYFIYSTKLGGSLVFNHGVGLNLGRKRINVDTFDAKGL